MSDTISNFKETAYSTPTDSELGVIKGELGTHLGDICQNMKYAIVGVIK